MSKLRQCKHYGYINGMACDKGVSLKLYSFHTAPCFPRNKETPCLERDWLTQAEIDAENTESASAFEAVFLARPLILAEKKPAGDIPCPKCKGKLHYTVSNYNGHIHAACETPGCVSWME